MRKVKFIALCLSGATIIGTASGASIYDQDYQSQTVNLPPVVAGATNYIGGPLASWQVVDSASLFADPFGGVGNKSLNMDFDETGSVLFHNVVASTVPNGLFGTGQFRTKFYHSSTGSVGSPLTQIALGALSSPGFFGGASRGAYIGINGDADMRVFDAAGNSIATLTTGVSYDTAHTIDVVFDSVANVFSVLVDGIPAQTAGLQTVFATANDLNLVNAFEIVAPTSSRTGRIWMDDTYLGDVLPIPEPGSLSLLACAGVMAFRRRRL